MRRLFIVRKDLGLTPGKMGAMVGHCCEAYWTSILKAGISPWKKENKLGQQLCYACNVELPVDVVDEYVFGIFKKTICEAKNLAQLEKAAAKAKELGLEEGSDWGYIRDCCLTELKPENDDGTCTVGVWFKPLDDDTAHAISKGFKLYGVFDRKRNCDVHQTYEKAYAAYATAHGDPNADFSGFARWLFEPFPGDAK